MAAAAPAFGHHNLLTDAGGEGLSKRSGALSIRSLRESGVEALAVAALAVLVGSAEAVRPVASLAELAATFDLADISRAAARFDEAELRALSARVLHHLPFAAVRERLEALGNRRAARRAVLDGGARQSRPFRRSGGMVGRRSRRDRADRRGPRRSSLKRPPVCREEPWDEKTWGAWTATLKALTGRKGRDLYHPLRLALTGREAGPELAALLPLIGRVRALDRLSAPSA